MSTLSTVTVTRHWVRVSDGKSCSEIVGQFASKKEAENELNLALYFPWIDENEENVRLVITND